MLSFTHYQNPDAAVTNLQARIVFTANHTDTKAKAISCQVVLNALYGNTSVNKAQLYCYEQKRKQCSKWAKVYAAHLNETNFYKLEKQYGRNETAEAAAKQTTLNGYRLPACTSYPI